MLRAWPLGLAYFVAAALAVGLTRFNGGLAFVWISSAIAIAALVRAPRRFWLAPILVCAIASFLATGLLGLGWKAAPAFAAINMVEAGIAGWLLRYHRNAGRALASLDWFFAFVLAAGIAGPLVGASLAAAWFLFEGRDWVSAFTAYFCGHALGNLIFTPLALLVISRRAWRSSVRALRERRAEALILVPLAALIGVATFLQSSLPLLFLPILPIILVAFRVGREGAALSIVLLALVGGAMTAMGRGPTMMLASTIGVRVMFLQFYLAATLLTVLPVAAELHARRRIVTRLRVSEERYRLLAEFSSDVMFHLELDGVIRYVSPAIRQYGYSEQDLIGRGSAILIDPDYLDVARRGHAAISNSSGGMHRYEYVGIAADGTRSWFETHARLIIDEAGEPDGMIAIVRDISSVKATEIMLTEAALTDSLTELPNRRAFRQAAAKLAPPSGSTADGLLCLALFDIDHFKQVNDCFGHDSGDAVLRRFAEIAQAMVRHGDIVARIGGEEFGILFPRTSIEKALAVCERFRMEVARTTMLIGGHAISVTVSGGVAVIGEGGLDRAMKIADRALYQAKEQGRDQLALAA